MPRWVVCLEGGPRRVNHAAVGVGEHIYSFGGYCTGDDFHLSEAIDVHKLNTNTMRWVCLPPRRDENGQPLRYPEVPFQRYGHTVVAYNDKIYMWGGRDDDQLCNVLYCFDPATLRWSRPPVTGGAIPGARDGHSACVINDGMYIFGGFVDEMNEFSCDVHCLNLNTMHWRYLQTFGVAPSFRDFHAAVALQGRMYIFGGRGDKHSPYHSHEEMYCSEIKYLDLKTNVWHRPRTTGKVPVGRRSHSMFVYNDLIYVFGGYNGLVDQHFNDLHTFDPKSNCWNLIKAHGKAPTARRRQACIVKDTRMFLFGGTSPKPNEIHSDQSNLIDNDDTYVLDFQPTLKTLCILAVIEYRMDIKFLPKEIQWDIHLMTKPNCISRPINHAG